MTEMTQDYSDAIFSLADINEACQRHITRFYPVGKQLTVERIGSDSDKATMHAFIDACLQWANLEVPAMDDLYQIMP